MCLKTDIRISIKNKTSGESHQRVSIKFIELILDFSIDNTKFVIKCQAEFLWLDWNRFQNEGCLSRRSACYLTLLWITNGLGEEHPLLWPQFKFLNRILPVAIMEPGCQTVRGSEEVNVLGNKTRVSVIIGLLNFRFSNRPIRLPRSQIVSGQINNIEDIHWSSSSIASSGS
jgi:hypothetical protein